MNLYQKILEIAKLLKKHDIIKDLLEIYEEIKILKSDMSYYGFFGLNDAKNLYHFYSPNIALQTIDYCLKNKQFDIVTEEQCNLILNDKTIKKYVDISTQANDLVMKELLSIFEISTMKNTSLENYIYNTTSEEVGYIGFIDNTKIFGEMKQQLTKYIEERNKIVDPNITLFPIKGFDKQFIKRMNELDINDNVIDAYEKYNIIFHTIIRIIYSYIYDDIYNIKTEEITILKSRTKGKIKILEFEITNLELLTVTSFPIFILKETFYFSYEVIHKIEENNAKTTYKCFTCESDEKDSLLNMSIIDAVSLFEK